jgi:hypothetical protein
VHLGHLNLLKWSSAGSAALDHPMAIVMNRATSTVTVAHALPRWGQTEEMSRFCRSYRRALSLSRVHSEPPISLLPLKLPSSVVLSA